MDLRQTGAVFRGVKVGVAKSRFKFHALAVCAALMTFATTGWGQTTISWANTGASTSWFTAANWSTSRSGANGSNTWQTTDIAQFNNNGTVSTSGINLGTASSGGGSLSIGAVEVSSARPRVLTIGNSSTTAGTLTLNGVTINSVANVILRNASAFLLTVQNNESGTGKTMGVVLGNNSDNIIQVDSAGVTISSVISGASKKLTISGAGAGVVTLSAANTYSGDTTVNNKLTLSGSGSIANSPNIILASGSTFDVSGLTTALSLGASQALKVSATGSSSTATLTVANSKGATLSGGGMLFTAYGGGATAPLTVTGATAGSLVVSGAPVVVTTTTALTAGTYKLVAKSGNATVSGTPGALTVGGSGLAAGTGGSLSVSSGELILTVSTPTLTAVTLGSALGASTYGTASAGTSFTAAGTALTGNITVTAQSGFEVSTSSGSGFGSSVSVASGTTVWVRTAATRAAGSFNSTTVAILSGGGAASSANVTSSASSNSVGTTTLTITAANQTVSYGTEVATVTTAGSYTPTGFVNGDTSSVIGGTASYTTTYTATTAAGSNVATITPVTTSLTATNYSFTAANGNITVTAVVPSAPSITGVTAGNGQLSVAFTAPSSNGGAGVSNYEYSTNGGTNWTTPNPAVTSSPLLITGLSNDTTYDVQIRAVNSAGSGTATGTTQGTPVAPSSPTISVSPATFASALSTTYGTASSTASFTVSGSTLSGNLTVTAPTGLEVSLTLGGSYSDSLNLTATSGTVTATTVFARLKATAAAGNYNSQSISVAGGGASTQSVATTATGNTVSQKVVTITGLGATGKLYDGTTSVTITGTAAYDGLVNGENHTVTDGVTWSFPDKSIGTGKVLTHSASYTAPNANYSLPVQPSLSADITAKELTGSFTANSKVFDNSTAATVATRAVSGAIEGDTVNHTGGTVTFDNANVGNDKVVTLASATLTGADAGNYTLTSVSTTTANITQGAAEITFAALPAGKKVGDAAFSAGATATLGATISYSSSNTAVATVNASTGLITLVAPGVTTINATVAGTANFTGDTESQTLNVAAAGGGTTTIFSENIGTPSGTTAITSNTFQNSSLTFSGNADVRTSTSSSGYTGASGGGNVFITSTANQRFEISGINSSAYSSLALSFGQHKSSTAGNNGLKVEVSSDGTNYTELTYTRATGTGTAVWALVQPTGSIPATANLRIRFTNTDTSTQWRIDDVVLTGTSSLVPAITPSGSFAAVTTTYGSASAASATTVTVTGGSLTAGIVATAPTGFEVSNDGATYDRTATFAQTGGFANGTLYLRLAANAAAGSRSGNVVLSSTGATPVNVPVVASTVTAKALSVTADAMSKVYGESDPTLTYTSDGLVNGDALSGSLSRAVGTAVGTYAISQGTLANPNYSISFTGANFTITAASLASSAITLTAVGDGSYTASGPEGSTFSYSYAGRSANEINTSYSSATAPTAAGYYTVSATATGNYSGSNTADYFVAGPVAVADPRTKSAGNTAQLIPISELLANDRRITSTGTVESTGLTVTGVTNGSGNTVTLAGAFIQFTPSSAATDTFTYTVTYEGKTATATVTVTTETEAPAFTLQIVKVGTAAFAGGNTTVTHDFIGVPGQTYLVEYATDLAGAWTSAGNQSTGATGSFSVTFTKSGDVAADWNAHMFFRARLLP